MILKYTFERQYLQKTQNSLNLNFPKLIECKPNNYFPDIPICLDFTLDIIQNKYLLCGFIDGNIIIYDVAHLGNSKLSKLLCTKKLPKGNINTLPIKCVQWYPVDIGMFFTCGADKKVKVWDTNRGVCVEEISLWNNINWISLSSCSSNSNLVAAACDKNKTILIDLLSGSSTHSLTNNYLEPIQTLQWSNCNEYLLATGDLGGHVSIWDIRRGKKPLYNLDQFQDRSSFSTNTLNCQAHSSAVRGLEFSPDGYSLASLGNDGRVNIWDIFPSGIKLMNLNFERLSIGDKVSKNIRFSWSGHSTYKKIWIPSNLNIACLDINSGNIKRFLSMHCDQITSCIWNAEFHQFYTLSLDTNIMTWKPIIN